MLVAPLTISHSAQTRTLLGGLLAVSVLEVVVLHVILEVLGVPRPVVLAIDLVSVGTIAFLGNQLRLARGGPHLVDDAHVHLRHRQRAVLQVPLASIDAVAWSAVGHPIIAAASTQVVGRPGDANVRLALDPPLGEIDTVFFNADERPAVDALRERAASARAAG